jgi:hypothetical protein
MFDGLMTSAGGNEKVFLLIFHAFVVSYGSIDGELDTGVYRSICLRHFWKTRTGFSQSPLGGETLFAFGNKLSTALVLS